MAGLQLTAVYPGISSLDPSRHAQPHPQLHSPIPLPVVPSLRSPPPPSSLPQPHFSVGSGSGRLLRSGITYPPPSPPHRTTSHNSINNATSPILGRPITKRHTFFDSLSRSNSILNNVSYEHAQGPWWTSNNVPSSPSQYNRAFPLLPTPVRRFSDNDWTVTVLSDDNTDMMQPSNSDLDLERSFRPRPQQRDQRRHHNNNINIGGRRSKK